MIALCPSNAPRRAARSAARAASARPRGGGGRPLLAILLPEHALVDVVVGFIGTRDLHQLDATHAPPVPHLPRGSIQTPGRMS